MRKIVRNLMLLSVATAMLTACGNEPEVTKKDDSENQKEQKQNEQGTPIAIENGAIKAAFSVSDSKQVYFSQGNLQYQASTNTWRFAEHQWDYVGKDNENISENYVGWIDLFGWGTSGYNGNNPYMTSRGVINHGDGNKNIAGTNYDWGVYNKISNGGNQAGLWRTLRDNEWSYLIFYRALAKNLMGTGRVNNEDGLILLPDSWTLPSGVTFTSGVADGPGSSYATVNNYSAEDWAKMESNGAVFLPAARYRDGSAVPQNNDGSVGFYWSSWTDVYGDPYYLNFRSYNVNNRGIDSHGLGFSVRLVQDVE